MFTDDISVFSALDSTAKRVVLKLLSLMSWSRTLRLYISAVSLLAMAATVLSPPSATDCIKISGNRGCKSSAERDRQEQGHRSKTDATLLA